MTKEREATGARPLTMSAEREAAIRSLTMLPGENGTRADWKDRSEAMFAELDAERAAHDATMAQRDELLAALEAVLAILSTEDVYSGLAPREFVRTRVCGITLGQESDLALLGARAAIAAARGQS